MEISKEIKALFLMQAKNEIADGHYPTVSSHPDNHNELEAEVIEYYDDLCRSYIDTLIEINYMPNLP